MPSASLPATPAFRSRADVDADADADVDADDDGAEISEQRLSLGLWLHR